MERNLYIKNSLFCPTRFCLKIIGPGEVNLIKADETRSMGEKRINSMVEEKRSMILLTG
jgi:hypothetical protein